jgi:hypothetical protein
VTYKYLYQDKENRNCEGEIKARDRAEAYMLLRKQGIRPYRVIGDDPFRWQPWAFSSGYAVLLAVIVALVMMLADRNSGADPKSTPSMTAEEAREFREKAEDAVIRAPDAFKFNVWKGVNARLIERGLEPIERPEGLVDE